VACAWVVELALFANPTKVMRVLSSAILAATAFALACAGEEESHPVSSPPLERAARVSTPAVAAEARPTPTPQPSTPAIPSRIVIDKIWVDAPVITLGLDENLEPFAPRNATEVAWYDFSERPGGGSNAVFAGNANWGGPAVLYDLDKLELGDSITVVGRDGTGIVYTVTDRQIVDANDPDSLSLMYATDEDVITLITEAGVYDGEEWSLRLVVRGRLVAVVTGLDPSPQPTVVPALADLEVTAVTLNPVSRDASTFSLDVSIGVSNNGPGTASVVLSPSFVVPPDCVLGIGGALGVGPMRALTEASLSAFRSVTCSASGAHRMTVTVSAALGEGGVSDPNPANNSGQATTEVEVSGPASSALR